MFLRVPDTMCGMEMSEAQRMDLAARIESKRRSEYGTRKAAYNAAKVNAATWSKAEAGQPDVAEYSLVAIVKALWPETGGDWRRMDPPLGGDGLSDIEVAAIRAPNLSDTVRADILRLLAGERERQARERGAS